MGSSKKHHLINKKEPMKEPQGKDLTLEALSTYEPLGKEVGVMHMQQTPMEENWLPKDNGQSPSEID
jgi:hypothetical protein